MELSFVKHMDICILFLFFFNCYYFYFIFIFFPRLKIRPSNETVLQCWSWCIRKYFWAVYSVFQGSAHRTVFVIQYAYLWWMSQYFSFHFRKVLSKNICRETLKMWVGYSCDCRSCVFAPSYPHPFLHLLTHQVIFLTTTVFHEGHKEQFITLGSFLDKQ